MGRGEAYEAFRAGVRLLEAGDAHAAAVALERARVLEPQKGSVREALGRAYLRVGRPQNAAEEFGEAVEIDPVNDYAHFGLGLSLLEVGDASGARRHLRLATAMRPDSHAYRRALARLPERAEGNAPDEE